MPKGSTEVMHYLHFLVSNFGYINLQFNSTKDSKKWKKTATISLFHWLQSSTNFS